MAKRIATRNRPNRVVENGAGWHIEYSPADHDYSAYIGNDYIGSRVTKDEARDLIADVACDGEDGQRAAT